MYNGGRDTNTRPHSRTREGSCLVSVQLMVYISKWARSVPFYLVFRLEPLQYREPPSLNRSPVTLPVVLQIVPPPVGPVGSGLPTHLVL